MKLNINKYEFLILFWVGLPLWCIAISLMMLLVSVKDSMCF